MAKRKRSGSETRKRTVIKTIRFLPEEWEEIESRADRASITPAAYIRMQCLNKPPPRKSRVPSYDKKLASQLLGHLGKIGSNINQIAHAANMGRTMEGQLQAALIDLVEMRNRWFEVFEKKP